MLNLSVAICTYNGESRVGTVLEKLRSQRNTAAFAWEILVINNNSTDGTLQVVEQIQRDWDQPYPLRCVTETEQGLSFARSRAIQEAQGEFVAFLDDDTVPDENWVMQTCRFAQDHPQVGAFGGQIHGDFEVEPPEDFKKVAVFLAIIERGVNPYCYKPQERMLPPGAGIVARRKAWLDAVPRRTILVGRVNGRMLASEDIEVIAHIQKAGWEIWYNPEMHLYHQIPQWRMERSYLLSLVKGIGLARHHVRMVRLFPWYRPLAVPVYLANDLRRILIHAIKHGRHITTDLAAACEMQLLLSSFVSPFYLWFISLKR
jgi:glycosyltransferase involved in cell wall biosynthesis